MLMCIERVGLHRRQWRDRIWRGNPRECLQQRCRFCVWQSIKARGSILLLERREDVGGELVQFASGGQCEAMFREFLLKPGNAWQFDAECGFALSHDFGVRPRNQTRIGQSLPRKFGARIVLSGGCEIAVTEDSLRHDLMTNDDVRD